MTGSALRANNFDLLRLLLAGTVMLVHAHVISGEAKLAFLGSWLSSEIAVKAFFVVSGLLVFMSYDRTRDLARYIEKRARRIYPAYFAVVTGSALLLFAFSVADPGEYATGAAKYLAANLVFLNFLWPTLPGVFENNPVRAVNGALWTLKIEVMFYIAVPVIAWCFARWGRLRTIAILYILSMLYAWTLERLARETGSELYAIWGRQLPGQISYFMVGAFWYYYLELFERHACKLVVAAAAMCAAQRLLPGWPLAALEPIWLGTLVTFLGVFRYAGNFGRYGDFSYGIYILHFPVLQAMVQLGAFAWSPLGALAISCASVLGASALLWHVVERPFLQRGSHYVLVTSKGG